VIWMWTKLDKLDVVNKKAVIHWRYVSGDSRNWFAIAELESKPDSMKDMFCTLVIAFGIHSSCRSRGGFCHSRHFLCRFGLFVELIDPLQRTGSQSFEHQHHEHEDIRRYN
jgi:hypothetical protein